MSSYTYRNITISWEVDKVPCPFYVWPGHATYAIKHGGVTEEIDRDGYGTREQANAAMMTELRRQIDALAAQEALKLRTWNELTNNQ